MKELLVQLNSISDVKALVTSSTMMQCDIDVLSGRYLVDAKSIMGLFSLDLGKPVIIQIHGTEEQYEEFYSAIKEMVLQD